MCRDLWHRLLDIECVAGTDDGQARDAAADLHVQICLGDDLVDEVAGTAGTEDGIGVFKAIKVKAHFLVYPARHGKRLAVEQFLAWMHGEAAKS